MDYSCHLVYDSLSEYHEPVEKKENKENPLSSLAKLQLTAPSDYHFNSHLQPPATVKGLIPSYLANADLKASALFLNKKLEVKKLSDFESLSELTWFEMPPKKISHLITIFDELEPKKVRFHSEISDGSSIIKFVRNIKSPEKIMQLDVSEVFLTLDELKEIARRLPNLNSIDLIDPSLIKGILGKRKAKGVFAKFVIAVLSARPDAWRHLPNKMRHDFDWMRQAMERDFDAIEVASLQLLNQAEFILKAIVLAKTAPLPHGIDDRKKDQLICLREGRAMKAITHASYDLRDDPDFMLQAMQLHKPAIKMATNRLKRKAKFMLAALQLNPEAIQEAAYSLKDNADFMLNAIQLTDRAVYLISPRLENDLAFMQKAVAVTEAVNEKFSEQLANFHIAEHKTPMI